MQKRYGTRSGPRKSAPKRPRRDPRKSLPAGRSSKARAEKLRRLERIIGNCRSALVAFSGGVDSTFLLSVAREVLGEKVVAVTVAFPAVPAAEVRHARALARRMRVKHVVFRADDVMELDSFRGNPPDRCYHCKVAIFSKLADAARALGAPCVLEASNTDDAADYRPGHRAVRELGARSPLIEARLGKDDIRALSRERGLSTWDKPSAACLASRIPYGEEITREKLGRIEGAEAYLASLGFGAVRVRSHQSLARIEVPAGEIERLLEPGLRRRIAARLKKLGFAYVTVDVEGYRTGSMNETLGRAVRKTRG